MSADAMALWPLYWLVGAAALLLGLDAWSKTRPALPSLTAFAALGFAAMALALLAAGGGGEDAHFVVNARVLKLEALMGVSTAVAAIGAGAYLREHGFERGEYYPLLTLALLGAAVWSRSNSALTFFVGVELLSIGIYGLVAFRRTASRSVEAGIKYFVLGSALAGTGLFGFTLLYAATGALSFPALAAALSANAVSATGLVLLGQLLVMAALLFKLGAAPFHAWTPDAYEGAPTVTTLAMAIVVKVAALVVAARIVGEVFLDVDSREGARGIGAMLSVAAVLSVVVGNVGALRQRNIKRLLGYSAVAHAGYLCVALATLPSAQATPSSDVMVTYAVAYAFGTALVLLALIVAGSQGKEAVHLDDVRGLFYRSKIAATAMALGFATLLGLPLTPGFIAKLMVIRGAAQADSAGLAVLVAIGSVVSAAYYVPATLQLFAQEAPPESEPMGARSPRWVALALTIACLAAGLLPGILLPS